MSPRKAGLPSAGSGVYSVRFPRLYRPSWAEVDLKALSRNLRRIKAKAGPRREVMFVVKADGYGHGAVQVARAALKTGRVSWLGVSSVEEGAVLRESGIRCPILILGSLYPFESTLAAVHYRLTPTIASLDGARSVLLAGNRVAPREKRRLPLSCHLKIDTGMGRIGVRWPAGRGIVDFLSGEKSVRLEGVFTHLSRADSDPEFTRRQLDSFEEAVADIGGSGLRVRFRHAANSAALLKYPRSRLNLVRPGLAAYGLHPGFEPVLSLKTKIVFLKTVKRGSSIGYGSYCVVKRASRVATLPIGYGDGLPRILGVRGPGRPASVLVKGRRCPVLGPLTMDMMMIDVTAIPGVGIGEEAVLIGRSGSARVTAAQLAEAAGTIPYEIATSLSARVPRVCV